MKIDFDNPKHESLVNDYDKLSRKFDRDKDKNADSILVVIGVLVAADTLYDVPPTYRPHPLKAKYKGYFAVDVTKTHRVIFRPDHDGDANFRIDNYKTISSIIIIEIFHNYH